MHNQKETAKGCKRIIEMDGSTTSLVNPADPTDRKTYSFDYSYWSFDGFIQDSSGKNVADANHPRGNQYSDQVCSLYGIISIGINMGLMIDATLFCRSVCSTIWVERCSPTRSTATIRHCSLTDKQDPGNHTRSLDMVRMKVV